MPFYQEKPKSWERLPRETNRQFEGFQYYLQCGPARTVEAAWAADYRVRTAAAPVAQAAFGTAVQVGDKGGDRVKTVSANWYRWSTKNNWRDRAIDYDAELARDTIRQNATRIASARENSDRIAELAQRLVERELVRYGQRTDPVQMGRLYPQAQPQQIEVLIENEIERQRNTSMILYRLTRALHSTASTRLLSLGAPAYADLDLDSSVAELKVEMREPEAEMLMQMFPDIDPSLFADPENVPVD